MKRHALTILLSGKPLNLCVQAKRVDPGATDEDNLQFVEAAVWIAKTGAPWRDLPDRLGNWHTHYTRFRRWAKAGRWQTIFKTLILFLLILLKYEQIVDRRSVLI